MKIIIHSLDELLELSELVTYGKVPRKVVQLRPDPAKDAELRAMLAEYREREVEGTQRQLAEGKISQDFATDKLAELGASPADIPTPLDAPMNAAVAQTSAALRQEAEATGKLDADGTPHNADWHSEPAKINADGRWRARRKRDEDAYKVWLLEQAAEVAEAAIAADEAEPVATETHALPQDKLPEGVTRRPEGAEDLEIAEENAVLEGDVEVPVDLEALIAASLEAAQDASDSHVDLLNACRDFTSKHGHPAFTALKAAVAPDDAGSGKAVQHFTPGERRLMQACIANYPSL